MWNLTTNATVINDHPRLLVVDIFKRIYPMNTLIFIDILIETFPVPIQTIQYDRGSEFIANAVQNWLIALVQRTMQNVFYFSIDHKYPNLTNSLGEWILEYNDQHIHDSPNMALMEGLSGKVHKTPYREEVASQYNPHKEWLGIRDYKTDQHLTCLYSSEVDTVLHALSSTEKQGA